jgi:hypothetical protein
MNVLKRKYLISPLKNEPAEIQAILKHLALCLCRDKHIDPKGEDMVFDHGYYSDTNNGEAIASWLFHFLDKTNPNNLGGPAL